MRRRVMTGVMGLVLAFAVQAGAAPVAGQGDHPAPDCRLVKFALPAELATWSSRVPVRTGGVLTVGQAVDAALRPAGRVRYAVPPEKPGDAVSYGGVFGFAVKEAGTYRVALGKGAWVDVVRARKAVASSAHGNGPSCSGVHKMVDFTLIPGRYTLQVAGNDTATLPVIIARLR